MLDKARLMLGWLQAIVMSDGNIPLLNDSAFGIAPSTAEIISYAKALGVEWEVASLGASGYRKFNGDCYDAFVDVAALGPSYNLGHSHADTFTFVMNVSGKPFIVDTGVSTYSAGERRDYERSTRAHNTVIVNGIDSSHVWGAFRCAQRAAVEVHADDEHTVMASHDGYASIGVIVRRTFVDKGNRLEIVDEVCGNKGNMEAVSTLLLSPQVDIVSVEPCRIRTSLGDICLKGCMSVDTEPVDVAVSYNLLRKTKRISVLFKERLSITIVVNQD